MSITEYSLAANMDYVISPDNIANLSSKAIAANQNRVAILIAVMPAADAEDFIVSLRRASDDAGILHLTKSAPIAYLHIKYFGALVQEALEVYNTSGDYMPLSVTEFTVERP